MDKFVQIAEGLIGSAALDMPDGPLQHDLSIPPLLQYLRIDLDGLWVLVERPVAVGLGNQGLRVGWLQLQALVEVLECVVEPMLPGEYLGPEDEGVEVFGVVVESVSELDSGTSTTWRDSSRFWFFLCEMARKR